MPHQVENEEKLAQLVAQLNRMECAPQNLAPHFGAWCRGRVGLNPAYVSFLPNSLHSIKGIATNVSLWAWYRARWANAVLASLKCSALMPDQKINQSSALPCDSSIIKS
jgi:hypothetical protein